MVTRDMPLPATHRYHTTPRLVEGNTEEWGQGLQGIFINIDWAATPMASFVRCS